MFDYSYIPNKKDGSSSTACNNQNHFMRIFLSGADAVCHLHEKGYTNDFQLFGNDLLWIQEKIFIRVGEFSIAEYHKIINLQEDGDELIIFGVYAPWHNVKGILVNHYQNYIHSTPPVLKKKLSELFTLAGISAFM